MNSLYREFFKDNLKVTCTVDDITTVRNYKRMDDKVLPKS